MMLLKDKIKTFQKKVWDFYLANGRDLPWRHTSDPYRIWVSEVMLQQTQVSRVVPKYKTFLKAFPTVEALARASSHDVLRLWVGLGYNRRALGLLRGAKEVVAKWKGKFPIEERDLVALSGIGPYTAGAIRAFAYNLPSAMLETNIRTVIIYEFFPRTKKKIDDKTLLEIAALAVDMKSPREWYWALMDYGSYLKKEGKNKNDRVKGYKKQSSLAGSNREVRGAIIRYLTAKGKGTEKSLKVLGFSEERLLLALSSLVHDGSIQLGSRKGEYKI